MKFLRQLGAGLLARRTLKALERIESHLAQQNRLLIRLADHFAPAFEDQPEPAGVGVDYLNPQEAGVVLDYIDRTTRDTGRSPTEEEILRYLADEATVDLQARMEAGG